MTCSDEWSFSGSAFPGSECRILDFNLAFESVLLSIVPNVCFFVLSVFHLHTLMAKELKIGTSVRSKTLFGLKLGISFLALAGSLLALIGWVTTGTESAYGVAALALSIPVSVSGLMWILRECGFNNSFI